MKLFHHTSATLLESILDDALSQGHLTFPNGKISDGIVWLTSDPMPFNHGLLDGTPLDEQGMVATERLHGTRPRNSATHDKRQVRITIDSHELGDSWVPFVTWAAAVDPTGSFGRSVGLSAIDGVAQMDDATILDAAQQGKTRENTWYLVPESILPAAFESLDAFVEGRHVPYDFESHGRESLALHGLIYPDEATLQTLPKVGSASHRFDRFTACVFAPSMSSPPHVRFRGYGVPTVVELNDDCTVHLTGPQHTHGPELAAWVRSHRAALDGLWLEAMDVARRYNAT